jgi:hypothetical protein
VLLQATAVNENDIFVISLIKKHKIKKYGKKIQQAILGVFMKLISSFINGWHRICFM